MNKRVVFGVLAAALVANPAWARASPDWAKVQAEMNALPQSGAPPQQVLDEIHQKVSPPAAAPAAWLVIKINTRDGFPSREDWKRNNDGTVSETIANDYASGQTIRVWDPVGLIEIRSGEYSSFVEIERSANLAISQPIDVAAPAITSEIKQQTLRTLGYNPEIGGIIVTDEDWKVSGTPQALTISASTTVHLSFNDRDATPPKNTTYGRHYQFDSRFSVFSPTDDQTELVDWKIENQPWHSQTISAVLSSAQKDQARALFARGFDLYKSGDLTGARALVESGLKTDPGNHLGWFTLGEIARSTHAQTPDDHWTEPAQKTYYQHTIDLAPDSPEAALAKGYLDALR
jgi:hypothetical protein